MRFELSFGFSESGNASALESLGRGGLRLLLWGHTRCAWGIDGQWGRQYGYLAKISGRGLEAKHQGVNELNSPTPLKGQSLLLVILRYPLGRVLISRFLSVSKPSVSNFAPTNSSERETAWDQV